MRILRITRIVLVLLVTGFLAFGCSPESEVVSPETAAYPFPASPDLLMKNFRQAYGAMDLEAYERVLHEDFAFSPRSCSLEKLGQGADHYGRDVELTIASRMFARQDHIKSDGRVVAAIEKIVFMHFEQVGGWAPVVDPERPGLVKGVYEVDIHFDRGEARSLSIRGDCVFYAVGDRRQGYKLVGWIDRT